MQPTNLNEYYQSQGQALPSVSNRVATAAKAGIQNYTGTADQNNQLLSYLQKPPAPQTGATNIQNPASAVQVPTPTNTPVPDINAATTTAPQQQYADTTNYDKSVADYQNLVNQEAQRAPDQLAAEQAAGVNEATATVNDLSSQLTSLNNESAAQKIALQNQPILGSIVAGQQDAVDRSRAVKALTISSALAAAQGKLGLAQAQADKAIAAKYGPIEAKLKYQQDFINLNYQNLSREDKKKADAFQVQLDAYKSQITNDKQVMQDVNGVLMNASKNGADAATIDAIKNSKTLSEAISAAGKYLQGSDLDMQIKKAQLQGEQTDILYKKAQIAKVLADNAASSPEAIIAQKQGETLDTLSLVDSILQDPYLDDVVGLKSPGAAFGGFFGNMIGSPTVKVQNQIRQLEGLLSLENRNKLKGSGAISDFEARTLQRAASSFSTGLSNEAAKNELTKIRGVMASASGLPTTVEIKDPKTGQSQVVQATRDGINQAIIDGLTVTYK